MPLLKFQNTLRQCKSVALDDIPPEIYDAVQHKKGCIEVHDRLWEICAWVIHSVTEQPPLKIKYSEWENHIPIHNYQHSYHITQNIKQWVSHTVALLDLGKSFRKCTRYNIYSTARLLDELKKANERGLSLTDDILTEDDNAIKFVSKLVELGHAFVANSRVYIIQCDKS